MRRVERLRKQGVVGPLNEERVDRINAERTRATLDRGRSKMMERFARERMERRGEKLFQHFLSGLELAHPAAYVLGEKGEERYVAAIEGSLYRIDTRPREVLRLEHTPRVVCTFEDWKGGAMTRIIGVRRWRVEIAERLNNCVPPFRCRIAEARFTTLRLYMSTAYEARRCGKAFAVIAEGYYGR
jgi:hypothetical protein